MSAMQSVRDIIRPAQAKARKEAAAQAALRAAEERMDLRWLLSDPRGKRIVARILSRCHLLAPTSQTDQRKTEQAEGRREFAISFWSDMVGAAPDEALSLFHLDPGFQRAREAGKPKDSKSA